MFTEENAGQHQWKAVIEGTGDEDQVLWGPRGVARVLDFLLDLMKLLESFSQRTDMIWNKEPMN